MSLHILLLFNFIFLKLIQRGLFRLETKHFQNYLFTDLYKLYSVLKQNCFSFIH